MNEHNYFCFNIFFFKTQKNEKIQEHIAGPESVFQWTQEMRALQPMICENNGV